MGVIIVMNISVLPPLMGNIDNTQGINMSTVNTKIDSINTCSISIL